jgi:cytochrome c oxidase subunit 4
MAGHGHTHDHDSAHEHGHHEPDHSHHIVEPTTYYKVFGALMVLLVITLLAAIPDLGVVNVAIAMTIAVAKAVLVLLFFMHLKYNTKLTQFFGAAAFFWLAIMFALILGDYVARHTMHFYPS